jgi:glycosyltransferase involved in cell wall biosynthesis
MKVIHLIKSLCWGGAEALLLEGFKVVDRSRFTLEYAYYIAEHSEVALQLQAQGAPVHLFDAGNEFGMMRAVAQTARYLKEAKADIVHAHLPLAGVVGRLAARRAGIPIVYTEHNPTDSYHPATQAASWATWGLQDRAIAISADVAASMRRHGGTRARIVTVPNGIDTDRFTPSGANREDVRARIGLPADVPVVGVVAQFRAQKQLDLWLAAARAIRDARPDARFLIVGNGPLWDEIRTTSTELGLDDAVLFAGAQADVRPYTEAMDVFMMTSKYEGAPLAPIEAMAMRVPVVSLEVEGIRNLVTSGTDGLLVPLGPDAVSRMAAEVVRLLDDPERKGRLSAAGRMVAVERYGLARMQRTLEALYEEVLSEHFGTSGTSAGWTDVPGPSL